MNMTRISPASRYSFLAIVVLLSACSAPAPPPVVSTPSVPAPSRPAAPPADFYHLPGEKPPKPYKVLGKWYQPMAHANGFMQQGIASWYGKDFHGKRTSSGEIYNMHNISAAHKTLPLHTWVRVTNLVNRKSLTLRINDRGPFVAGRIIDLSYAAAKKLGLAGPGTAPVEIIALGTRPPEKGTGHRSAGADTTGKAAVFLSPSPSLIKPMAVSGQQYRVQVGAYIKKENAEQMARKLKDHHGDTTIRPTPRRVGNAFLYRVLVGEYASLDEAERHEARLRKQGYDGAFAVAD